MDGSRKAVESATGTVAGSVAVTPATRLLDGEQSPPIDMLSAATCSLVVHIAAAIPFDDGLGTFMHPGGGGGMVGALPTGSLVSKPLMPGDYFPISIKILEESGRFGLIIAKINIFFPPYGFAALGTAIMRLILGALMPPRVSSEEEERSLDFVSYGEETYDPMTN